MAFRTQAGAGPANVGTQYRYDSARRRVHKVVCRLSGPEEAKLTVSGLFERR